MPELTPRMSRPKLDRLNELANDASGYLAEAAEMAADPDTATPENVASLLTSLACAVSRIADELQAAAVHEQHVAEETQRLVSQGWEILNKGTASPSPLKSPSR